jgi:GTPase SAR1 family protein
MPFTHPFASKLCPLCFETFHLSEAPIGSRATGKTLVNRSSRGPFRGWFVSDLSENHQFIGQDPRRVCPRCHQHLPTKIDYMSNELIAIVGSTAAGKSHYITTLINELRTRPFLSQIGCRPLVSAEQETDDTYDNDYFQPLYGRKEELPPTTSRARRQAPRPLMFQLIRPHPVNFKTQRINLVFFDTAGEDVADSNVLGTVYNRYITRASGIILFIDPLQVTNLSSALASSGRPGVAIDGKHGTDKVIERMVRVFQQQTSMKPGDQISIPTALVLSKADMLWNLPGVSKSSPLFQESLHQRGFDVEDHLALKQEIVDLLEQSGGNAILEQAKASFKRYSFFAVTATGCSAGPQNHQFPAILPKRCVDPLLWILWQLGMAKQQGGQ